VVVTVVMWVLLAVLAVAVRLQVVITVEEEVAEVTVEEQVVPTAGLAWKVLRHHLVAVEDPICLPPVRIR